MDFFKPDAFLSAVLGKDAYCLVTAPTTGHPSEFLQDCAERMADPRFFATAKAPAQDVAGLAALVLAGFLPVDVNLSFERPFRAKEEVPPQTFLGLVRLAQPKDEAAVRRISAASLTSSRFHLDPAIAPELSSRIKADWAGNYFSGRRGQAMAVAEKDGSVVGFLLLIFSGQTLVIDLLAVDEQHRRQGIGAALIAFAETTLPSFTTLAVGTQAANKGSVRFYESQGLRYTGANYVLHAHGARHAHR